MSFNSFSKNSDDSGKPGATAAPKPVTTKPSTAVARDKDVADPAKKTPPKA